MYSYLVKTADNISFCKNFDISAYLLKYFHSSINQQSKDWMHAWLAWPAPFTAPIISSLIASNVFVMVCSNSQSEPKEIVQWTELKLPVAFWQKVKRDKLRTPSLMEMLCEDFRHTERCFLLKGSLRVKLRDLWNKKNLLWNRMWEVNWYPVWKLLTSERGEHPGCNGTFQQCHEK